MKTLATTHVDLTNCDREPIQFSGAIQPHGILFALEVEQLTIVRASENTLSVFGINPLELLGQPIEVILGSANAALLREAAAHGQFRDVNPLGMTLRTSGGDLRVEAVLHRSGAQIVLELEPAQIPAAASPRDFQRLVRGGVERFGAVRTVRELCAAAAAEIARETGFDRVMIYRFDDDWHGEVIAEQRARAMTSYLGLHYPSSDIPRQAREIFKRNWLRFIPNVNDRPVAIVPAGAAAGELDLSQSILRSVSPLHIEYLQNMGVAATMTVSLLKNGELWGLIACHHQTPKMVPYELRFACEIMARTMSLHLGSLEESEDAHYRMRLKSAQLRLLDAMTRGGDVWRALGAAEPDLLSLVGAEGAAIRYGTECTLVGRTPPRADVMAIADWLSANDSAGMFVSDALPLREPAFAPLRDTACGIIALPLSHAKGNYIIWFRPEVIVTVNWGGDPNKSAERARDGERLTPRKSFDLWCEIVRQHSRSWKPVEIAAAREWRHFVGSLIVERAEQLERVNRELASSNIELESLLRSNIELDSFAHIASHDLKEPLRGIHNYANFLLEDYGTVVGEDGREKLETLVRLSQRMESLIDSLLRLAGIGRVDLTGSRTDLRRVIDDVLELYGPRLEQCRGSVSIAAPLPFVFVDRVRLGEVFNNLLSNAMKYTDRPPRIEIGVDPDRRPPLEIVANSPALPTRGKFITVFVRDHGIGIRSKHLGSVFQMFKRLHAAQVYGGGTGAGLAIARKIVERHAGHMWAESTFGEGTTFYFTVPAAD